MLAGGRSTRFGSDKLAAPYHGLPLLHHAILRLAEVCGEVLVVLAPAAAEPTLPVAVPVRIARDATEGEGPLSGLLAGMAEARTPWVLAAGGDMPDLQTSVLLELLGVASTAPADAVALREGDHVRPLPLAVRVEPGREAVHTLLHAGERRLRALSDALRTAVIDESTWLALDPERRTLRDVDEPGDLPPGDR